MLTVLQGIASCLRYSEKLCFCVTFWMMLVELLKKLVYYNNIISCFIRQFFPVYIIYYMCICESCFCFPNNFLLIDIVTQFSVLDEMLFCEYFVPINMFGFVSIIKAGCIEVMVCAVFLTTLESTLQLPLSPLQVITLFWIFYEKFLSRSLSGLLLFKESLTFGCHVCFLWICLLIVHIGAN